jgi:chorismate lyase/3-hydroxybenzoate synthase
MRETVTNIRALVAGGEPFAPGRLKYKAYVRRPGDLAAVAAQITAAVQPAAPIVYFNADVCREDLFVEIEAVGGAGPVKLRWW